MGVCIKYVSKYVNDKSAIENKIQFQYKNNVELNMLKILLTLFLANSKIKNDKLSPLKEIGLILYFLRLTNKSTNVLKYSINVSELIKITLFGAKILCFFIIF